MGGYDSTRRRTHLRQIIRPDFLAPVRCADEVTSYGSSVGLFFCKFEVHKTGGEDLVGAPAVLDKRKVKQVSERSDIAEKKGRCGNERTSC